MTDEPIAALLVRVWLEGGTDQFRARVSAVGSVTLDEGRTLVLTTSPSDVIDAVSQWLDEFLRSGAPTD